MLAGHGANALFHVEDILGATLALCTEVDGLARWT